EAPVGVNEVRVRVGLLGILIEILHVRVGRGRVQVKVVLLNVLAVVRFTVGEAEQPFLKNGILPVPQGQGEAEKLLVIRDARQPVFSPPVGAGTRLVMAEIVPGIAIVAIILPHRAPLPLAQVRSPLLPGSLLISILFKSNLFSVHSLYLSLWVAWKTKPSL